MADPILGMRELVEGDSLGYLSQNDRNLVMARLMAPRIALGDDASGVDDPGVTTTGQPSGITVARGDLFIVSATPTAAGVFDGQASKIAIAMSATPQAAGGYTFITAQAGMRVQADNGTTVTNYIYDGTSWVSI